MTSEEMGEELNHFSHEEHPLILIQVQKKDNDDDDEKEVICYGCQKQIFEPEAYSCNPCHFFLHKRCAELPLKIWHPLHSPHPLVLLKEPPPYYAGIVCDACNQDGWKFFTYHCSSCEFDLDVTCATVEWKFEEEIVDRRFEHECHEHPLILQHRPAYFFCDACYTEDKDSSYFCTSCPFWIHRSCALLPKTFDYKHHNHPLSLAYSLPPGPYSNFIQKCGICHQKILRQMWFYYCSDCRYLVHIYCATSIETKSSENDNDHDPTLDGGSNLQEDHHDQRTWTQNLVKLPLAHAAQEMITRFLIKGNGCSSSSTRKTDEMTVKEGAIVSHYSHKHSLTLSKVAQSQDEIKIGSEDAVLLCDGCIEPICVPDQYYYGCAECNYFLHMACAKLPSTIHSPKHPQHPLALCIPFSSANYMTCNACLAYGTGFSYACEPCNYEFCLCVKCASASLCTTIAHDAHKHLLTQIESSTANKCTACGHDRNDFAFACKDCDFYLDYECALVPPTTRQRSEKHPLVLSYPPYFDHPDEFNYCITCEKEMNPNCWMYHCSECDCSVHIWCFPRFGKFRNLKFGQTLHVDTHSHPLTHVPEAKYESLCANCGPSLDWEVAFECKACTFTLCRHCAWAKESKT